MPPGLALDEGTGTLIGTVPADFLSYTADDFVRNNLTCSSGTASAANGGGAIVSCVVRMHARDDNDATIVIPSVNLELREPFTITCPSGAAANVELAWGALDRCVVWCNCMHSHPKRQAEQRGRMWPVPTYSWCKNADRPTFIHWYFCLRLCVSGCVIFSTPLFNLSDSNSFYYLPVDLPSFTLPPGLRVEANNGHLTGNPCE